MLRAEGRKGGREGGREEGGREQGEERERRKHTDLEWKKKIGESKQQPS